MEAVTQDLSSDSSAANRPVVYCGDRELHDPTPETIAELCREIRQGWTPATRRSRRVVANRRVETAVVRREDMETK
ncbi:MAG: hypothetical protein AAGJ46_09815 [Planctomycetota bacterium]